MPLLQGGSLRDRLLRDGRLAPEEAVRLARQVASALEAAHALGLVHRDVKPENILLDANGDALLTDFGIARELAVLKQSGVTRTLARTGIPMGTPEYMAPEQLLGEPTDQRVDVYALGAVLYELLVGTPPFDADTPYAIAAQVLTAPLVPPSRLNGAIWPALEQVVLRALARDPSERYPDVQSFSAALDLALRHQTDAAPLPWTAPALTRTWTVPLLPSSLLRTAPKTGRMAHLLRGEGRTRARVALTLTLATLLLAGAMGSVLVLLNRAGTSTAGTTGGASNLGVFGAGTATSATSATTSVPTATASAHHDPTATPVSANATPTPPSPAPTPTPTPTLIIQPMPLVLTPSAQYPNTCIATQTITNTTGQSVGWQWQKPAVGGFHFQINGGPELGWPTDWSPGIPPGQTDMLSATANCQPQTQSYGILLTDTLGDQYTFVLQLR